MGIIDNFRDLFKVAETVNNTDLYKKLSELQNSVGHSVEGRVGLTEFTTQEGDLENWRTFAVGIRTSKNSKGEKKP